ncbi:MAG: hypothetical protein AAGB04_00160 [Pseudomonadota bacterium]
MLKFSTHEDIPSLTSEVDGTCQQGAIKCSYDELVDKFGSPITDCVSDDKSYAVWFVRFEDCTIATICDWKTHKSYCGADGSEIEDVTQWSIGGRSRNSASHVYDALGISKYSIEEVSEHWRDALGCNYRLLCCGAVLDRYTDHEEAKSQLALLKKRESELIAVSG